MYYQNYHNRTMLSSRSYIIIGKDPNTIFKEVVNLLYSIVERINIGHILQIGTDATLTNAMEYLNIYLMETILVQLATGCNSWINNILSFT